MLTLLYAIQQLDADVIQRDFSRIAPVVVRKVDFQPRIVGERSRLYRGEVISRDGVMLFAPSVLGRELISLTTGDYLSSESVWSGQLVDGQRDVVATGSQFSHMRYEGLLKSATLADARSSNEWLVAATTKGGHSCIAFVDVKSRAIPPNKLFRTLPIDKRPIRAFVSSRSLYYCKDGMRHIVFQQDAQRKKAQLLVSTWTNQGKERPRKRIAIKGWAAQNQPYDVDITSQRVAYRLEGGESTEYDINTKRTTLVPRKGWLSFWRHKQLVEFGHKELSLFENGFTSETRIGGYSIWGESTDQRFMLIQRSEDSSFWLLDFKTSVED